MKKIFTSWLFLLVFLAAILNSCTSHKHLTYLADSRDTDTLAGAPTMPVPYQIKPKDNLYVSIISSNPEMNKLYNPSQAGTQAMISNNFETLSDQYINGYEVDLTGNINLPLIGKLEVSGKTLQESELIIENAARQYLKDVTAKVKILNYRITVLGEVKNPGVYYNYNRDINVIDALGMANGTTEFAKFDKVTVMRPSMNGTITYTLNLQSKSMLTSDAFFLQPNDVVFVQPGKQKNLPMRAPIITIIISSISSVLLFLNYIKN